MPNRRRPPRYPAGGSLRRMLAEHKLAAGRGGIDLVLDRTASLPFIPTTIRSRALKSVDALI